MPDPRKILEAVKNPRVLAPTGFAVATGAAAGVFGFLLNNWVYFAVAMLIMLAGLIAYLIVSMHRRESSERAARGTGAADDATVMQRRPELRPPPSGASNLEERFKKAHAVIQARSLQTLPWYLVVGPSGSGKSAFLRASGLKLPPAVESLVEHGPTSSVNFWLSDDAVLVDMAGRLTATHEGDDHKDWRQLLGLVAKHRRRPAFQGVLVALSAADLLTSPAAQLESEASELRRHLNEVVDLLGIDAPVYLVITQSDRVLGFAETAAGFPVSRLNEMYGWTNRDRHPSDIAQSLRDAFSRMSSRLELALPELLVREPDVARRGRAVLLPHELNALGKALASFAARAFQPTRYDEVPFLRGVYLTSARREGELVSPVLERLGQRFSAGGVDPGGPPGGWFMRDLFKRLILDTEEQALCVVTERVGPRTRTVLVGVASLVALACAGFWGTSFVNNWRSIGELRERAQAAIAQRSSLKGIDELRVRVLQAESDRAGLWHGFGLGPALGHAVANAKQTFALLFFEQFEQTTKSALIETVAPANPAAFAALLDLMADLNFLENRGEDESLRPRIEDYALGTISGNVRESFAPNYVAWARWAGDTEREAERKREQNHFDARAAQLLRISNLEAWCKSAASREKLPDAVKPETFFGGALAMESVDALAAPPLALAAPSLEVSGCYTKEFYERWLDRVFASLDPNDLEAKRNLRAFRDDYAARYRDAWQSFVLGAPRAPRVDPKVLESPYLALIESVLTNTDVAGLWAGAVATPGWVTALRDVRREGGGTEEKPAPWAQYTAVLEEVSAEVERSLPSKIALEEARKAGSGAESAYKKALATIKQLLPAPLDNPDRTTLQALQALLKMPVLNGFSAVLQAAATEIDSEWKYRIVAPFAGQSASPELHQQLCGPNGAINGFRTDVLGPFWTGTMPRPLLEDRALPLSPRFAAYFGSACGGGGPGGGGGGPAPTGPQTVTLTGAPSDVRGAENVFVISSKLTLLCAMGEPQEFEYSDGQGRRPFRWDPEGGCEMVTLSARVRDSNGNEQDLERSWNGPFAFAQFLRSGEARGDGSQSWSIKDPYGSALTALVRYRRNGGEGILRFEEAASRSLPESVR
jgi:hypothetical protein